MLGDQKASSSPLVICDGPIPPPTLTGVHIEEWSEKLYSQHDYSAGIASFVLGKMYLMVA